MSKRHKVMLDRLAELLRQQPIERQEQLMRELESGRLFADEQTDETQNDPDSE